MSGMSGVNCSDAMQAVDLVLHADDFGMSDCVNSGIAEGFDRGILTSTSLMANGPAFEHAVDQWLSVLRIQQDGKLRSRSARSRLSDSKSPFDLGVHLNLTEGRPLTGSEFPAEFLDRQKRFLSIGRFARQLWRHGRRSRAHLRRELSAQIRRVHDAGLQVTHLNGHQYIELLPGVSEIVVELLREFQISSVRLARESAIAANTIGYRRDVVGCVLGLAKRTFAHRFAKRLGGPDITHAAAFFGTCHAGMIEEELVGRFLSQSKPCHRLEIGLHPAIASCCTNEADRENGWHDPLWQQRCDELEMLKSESLVQLLLERHYRLGRLSDWADASQAHTRRAVA